MVDTASTPTKRELTLEDHWYAALDDQVVDVGRERLFLRVVGIHQSDGGLWIQLAPLQADDRGLLIHARQTQTPDDVLKAVRIHLQIGPMTHVVEVGRRV